MSLNKKLNIACIQTICRMDVDDNLKRVGELIKKVKEEKPETDLIVLPEHFSNVIKKEIYLSTCEVIPGKRTNQLSQWAKQYKIYILGGSFPEKDGDKLYNTALAFDKNGNIIGKHRKVHLFDIDIPGKITVKESNTFSGGKTATLVELPEYGIVSTAICYDIRFPEMATIASRAGAFAMFYPSAFNQTTGPMHWTLLARSRALDNQMYVIMCSPAAINDVEYPVYGHSMIVDPTGKVLVEAGEGEEIIYAELDPELITTFRQQIPITTQRRHDIYKDVSQGAITTCVEVAAMD